jgi:hypothetical protein
MSDASRSGNLGDDGCTTPVRTAGGNQLGSDPEWQQNIRPESNSLARLDVGDRVDHHHLTAVRKPPNTKEMPVVGRAVKRDNKRRAPRGYQSVTGDVTLNSAIGRDGGHNVKAVARIGSLENGATGAVDNVVGRQTPASTADNTSACITVEARSGGAALTVQDDGVAKLEPSSCDQPTESGTLLAMGLSAKLALTPHQPQLHRVQRERRLRQAGELQV